MERNIYSAIPAFVFAKGEKDFNIFYYRSKALKAMVECPLMTLKVFEINMLRSSDWKTLFNLKQLGAQISSELGKV